MRFLSPGANKLRGRAKKPTARCVIASCLGAGSGLGCSWGKRVSSDVGASRAVAGAAADHPARGQLVAAAGDLDDVVGDEVRGGVRRALPGQPWAPVPDGGAVVADEGGVAHLR